MTYARLFTAAVVFTAVTLMPLSSFAQARGRTGAPAGGRTGPTVGRAVPRPSYPAGGYRPPSYRPGYPPNYYYPRYGYGGGYYGYPYGFYPYGSFGFGYWHGSVGFSVGIGLPVYGYGYPYYGGYPYASYSAYPAYSYPGYGGVRILDAPKGGQVLVDGYYAGVVDDFDGTTQQVRLEPGVHHLEIRAPGFETASIDVHTQAGQTIRYLASMRPTQQ